MASNAENGCIWWRHHGVLRVGLPATSCHFIYRSDSNCGIRYKYAITHPVAESTGATPAKTHLGWGLLNQFPQFRYYLIFSTLSNTHYVLNITFIFGRCHCSPAAETPAKYECDSKNLTDTFARSNILLTEKLTNGALVTPPLHGELVLFNVATPPLFCSLSFLYLGTSYPTPNV